VRAGQFHRVRPRQRVHRGRGRSLHLGADRAGPHPLPHHDHRSRVLEAAPAAAREGRRRARVSASLAIATNRTYLRRRRMNAAMIGLSTFALVFGLFWLTWIIGVLLYEGAVALRPSLFIEMTPPPGGDGGLANAIIGSVLMSGVGTLIGTPVGILAGTYLAEY